MCHTASGNCSDGRPLGHSELSLSRARYRAHAYAHRVAIDLKTNIHEEPNPRRLLHPPPHPFRGKRMTLIFCTLQNATASSLPLWAFRRELLLGELQQLHSTCTHNVVFRSAPPPRIQNLKEIRRAGVELFKADRRTDGCQTDRQTWWR
jgi:hypothetical protein